jgi:hypothetical protein
MVTQRIIGARYTIINPVLTVKLGRRWFFCGLLVGGIGWWKSLSEAFTGCYIRKAYQLRLSQLLALAECVPARRVSARFYVVISC